MSNETLTMICRGCGLPIGEDDIAASVMVSVWVPRLGQYRGEGPLHGDCGKRHGMQAQTDSKTPNVELTGAEGVRVECKVRGCWPRRGLK